MPYKQPPTEHQFKPGQSGNPHGMPKGTKLISTWINELLNDETFIVKIREGKKFKEYKGAPIKAIIKAQTTLAMAGDTKAADMLFKHGAPQRMLLGNDPDNPLPETKLIDNDTLSQFMMMMKDNTKQ